MVDRAHQRKLIRQAVVSVLKSGVPAVSNRVFPQRKIPLEESKLPAILVYTTSENVEKLDNINYKRTLKLSIEIINDGDDEITVAESLDDLAQSVELTVLDNEFFNDTIHMSILTSSEEAFEDQGKNIVGAVRLQYDLIYYTESVADEGGNALESMAGNIAGYESENQFPQ